ncbi:TPA: hypothetical protein ODN92_005342, partial [Escherichia coli]|nr:hypothetical protein [Escherichia coli]
LIFHYPPRLRFPSFEDGSDHLIVENHAALFHFAFHASPLPMRDDAAKSDREQPEIDRGHNDFECRVHIFSSCD